MILADTSVWIRHFRKADARLQKLLYANEVLIHPFIIGEIACGNLRNRGLILDNLNRLPRASVASHEETLHFVKDYQLWGKGVGWIDMHLLASARLSGCRLWSLDRRLSTVAASCNRNDLR